MRYIRLIIAALLILTGILHVVQFWILGNSFDRISYPVGGIVYFTLGILLLLVKARWVIWLGVLLPAFGLASSLVNVISTQNMPAIYPLLVVIDVIVVIGSIILLKQKERETAH